MFKHVPTLEEFIASNPTRELVAQAICQVANQNVLELTDTFVWEPLSKLGGFTADDFYDDVQATYDFYGKDALEIHGIVWWKLKEGVL